MWRNVERNHVLHSFPIKLKKKKKKRSGHDRGMDLEPAVKALL